MADEPFGTGLERFRSQYPQYDNLSDTDLADRLYNKFYAQKMPRELFNRRMGYDPKVAGMGGVERFARGAAFQLGEWKRGLEQTLSTPSEHALFKHPKGEAIMKQHLRELQQEERTARAEAEPLMRTTGAKVGRFAAEAAPFAIPGAGTWLGAATVGGAEGLLTPTTGTESRAVNTALGAVGGVAGKAVGNVLGKVVQPWTRRGNARESAIELLLRRRIPLDTEQVSGSRWMQTVKIAAQDAPVETDAGFEQRQLEQYTRGALEHMGLEGEIEARPDILNERRLELKAIYNALNRRYIIRMYPRMSGPNPPGLNDPLASALRDIRNRIQNSLEPNPRALIEHQIQNLFDAVGGEDGLGGAIPADRIQNVHTALDEMTATGIAPFKRDLRNALNRAIERAATPEDRALLARNDREYSAMKQIAAAMRGSDDFMVRPGRLFTATRVARRELQSIYGVGPNAELAEYARAGRLILGNKTPQSGTPRRAAALGSFSALGTGLAGAFGFAGYEAQERTGRHGGIPPWVVGVASAAFGPAMVRKAIESPALAARISQWARSQGITDAASATRYLATIGGGAAGVQMAEPGIGQQRPAINLTDMD